MLGPLLRRLATLGGSVALVLLALVAVPYIKTRKVGLFCLSYLL